MTNQTNQQNDHDTEVKVGDHDVSPLAQGIADFLGIKLSGKAVQSVNIKDTVKSFSKTPLGGMAYAFGSSVIEILFHEEVQKVEAQVEKEIARIESAMPAEEES